MNFCIKEEYIDEPKPNPKIPRPLNAFMLYANENRKKMSQMYPTESNKEISKRLGNEWKTLNDEDRRRFFDRAKVIGLQHKKEYPDYVYNPKEARIRKAMRDATRERSIGASPMLPRPNIRRATHNNWLPPHEDLMMSQLGPPICGGFPLPPNGNNQFISTMNNGGYTKLEPSSMPSSTSNTLHTNYMESNPLAQLQHQTEMWHNYQTMRPRSSGNTYMIPEVPSYHSQTDEIANSMMIDKQQTTQPNLENDPSIQAPPPPLSTDCNVQEKNHEVGNFDGKTILEGTQNSNSQDHFIPVFEQTANEVETRYDPIDDRNNKLKKDEIRSFLDGQQSIDDPKYQNDYILKYFEKLPSMSLMNITTSDGFCFPYATFTPNSLTDIVENEMKVFENIPEPSFYYTDIGYIPLT